jgi:hypothetical protein
MPWQKRELKQLEGLLTETEYDGDDRGEESEHSLDPGDGSDEDAYAANR